MSTIARLPPCSQPLAQHIEIAAGVAPRLVRSALPLLREEPPLTLGRSQLAVCLLPQLPALYRGQLLQRALLLSIERLRPSQEITRDDPCAWPYLLYRAEYVDGHGRREIEGRLAISTSTYTRVKRQALGRIAALLPLLIVQLSDASVAATNWPALLAHLRLLLDVASVYAVHPVADQAERRLVSGVRDLQEALHQLLVSCAPTPTSSSIPLALQQAEE
jgi:hypothetical protein